MSTTTPRYFSFTCIASSSFMIDGEMSAVLRCTPEQIVDGLLKPTIQTRLPDPDQIEAAVLAATRVLAIACTNRDNEALQNAAHELRRVSGIALDGQVAT